MNSATGAVNGTASQTGTFTVTVTVTDRPPGGLPTPISKQLTLTVNALIAPVITVSTTSLPGARLGLPYTPFPLSASGGAAPYTFKVTGLPSGLVQVGGMISGTPVQTGVFSVSISATDSSSASVGGPFTSTTIAPSLAVTASPGIAITTASLPGGRIGTPYTSPPMTVSGGTSAYTFVATGLPPGLTMTPAFGVISGTPTQIGTYTVAVRVVDSTPPALGGPLSSPTVNLSLAIGTGAQTISFPKPADVVFRQGLTVQLGATASSGLAVTYTSLTPTVCSVTNATATIAAPGTCSIAASQPGNASYPAAAVVTQSFSIGGTPGLALAVTATPTTFAGPGLAISLAFTLTNTGNVPLTALSVADSRAAGVSCPAITLAAGAKVGCTGSFTTTAGDVVARGIALSTTAKAAFGTTAVASAAVTTTVGIAAAAVQQQTQQTVQTVLSQSASTITSSGPDVGRMHDQLGGYDSGPEGGGGGGGGDIGGGAFAPAAAPPTSVRSMAGSFGFGSGSGLGSDGAAAGHERLGESFAGVGSAGGAFERQDPIEDRRRSAAVAPFGFSGSADNSYGRFAFSMSLTQLRKSAEANDAARKAEAARSGEAETSESRSERNSLGLSAGPSVAMAPAKRSAFDVWIEGTTSYYRREQADGGKRQGHTAVALLGADYVVRPGLLIGFMGQIDRMGETSETQTQNRDGRGWMMGPYLSSRLLRNLYFDARLAWGQSTQRIDPIGAYTDSFATERALVSAKLTGDWMAGALRLRPSVEVSYFTEQQKEYVSAIGVAIGAQTYAVGRAVAGPELGYRLQLEDKSVLEPFVGVKGVWDFSTSQSSVAAGTPVGNDTLRARIEAGASLRASSGITLRGQGTVDGLGSDGYRSYQGQVRLLVPLQ